MIRFPAFIFVRLKRKYIQDLALRFGMFFLASIEFMTCRIGIHLKIPQRHYRNSMNTVEEIQNTPLRFERSLGARLEF